MFQGADIWALSHLPILPLVAAAIPLIAHLVLFARWRFGDGYGHITYWGVFAVMARVLMALIVLSALFVPGSVAGYLESGAADSIWYPLALTGVGVGILVVVRRVCRRWGRCLIIDRRTGRLRFYRMDRLWPAPAQFRVDNCREVKSIPGAVYAAEDHVV